MDGATDTTWQVEQLRWKGAWTRANRTLSTLEAYQREISKYLDWCDEGALDTSSRSSADLYIDHVQRSKSQHMSRHAARALKAYGKFLQEEYEEGDPFAKLKLPKEPQPSAKHSVMATDDDLSKLLATCDRSTFVGERDWCIIMMLSLTGMRRGELANLRLEDVDLVRKTIHIAKGKTEAARRNLHMPEPLQGALLRYLKKREALVKRNAKYPGYEDRATGLWLTEVITQPVLMANGITQMLRKRGIASNVDVRAHAFRRRHASSWLARGGSETGLMANSGWTSTAMVARYTRDAKESNAALEAERLFG